MHMSNIASIAVCVCVCCHYLLTELSPSREAANCTTIQEIPSNFTEPEGSSPCSQEHSSGPYPEQVSSSTTHPISLRSILILSTHLHLGLPSGLFPVVMVIFLPNRCLSKMRETYIDTDTDGVDLWSMLLRWAQVPWYTYIFVQPFRSLWWGEYADSKVIS
jgi:hypothetical protein